MSHCGWYSIRCAGPQSARDLALVFSPYNFHARSGLLTPAAGEVWNQDSGALRSFGCWRDIVLAMVTFDQSALSAPAAEFRAIRLPLRAHGGAA